jgi:hypothetical protein
MIGTPDDRKSGLFYELTKDIGVNPPQQIMREGWKVFTWSTVDNPYMREQWAETKRELLEADPHVEEQPWYQQHYLGRWVVDDSAKIYRYAGDRNAWDGKLKDYGWNPWQYTLGIDLGFNDATALVLMAYHQHDPNVYILKADKRKGLTLTEASDWIREWMGQWEIGYFIVDGANKQAVEEMVKHHQLPLQAAEKSDKVSFIRIMNSDFISGKIKVFGSQCQPLIEEYEKTIWNKRHLEKGIYKEDTGFHPDCADAALYAYRFCYHYANTPAPPKMTPEREWQLQKEKWDAEFAQKKQEKQELMFGSEYLYD